MKNKKINLYLMPCNARNDNYDDSILSKILFFTVILAAVLNGVTESVPL